MGANPATLARKPGPKLLVAAGGLATLVSLSPLALSAAAEEPDGPTDSAQQRPAGSDRVSLRLNAVVEELEGLRDEPGFGSFDLDEDHCTVTVGWKGVLPEDLVGKLSPRPDGVTVEVRPVAYAEGEMQDLVNALGREARRSEWPWVAVRPDEEYGGLVVELDKNQVTEGSRQAVELEQRIRASTSVPVRFEHVDGGYIDR